MAYGTVNTDNLTSSDGGVISPNINSLRNRIINGAMVIDQRNAGAAITTGDYALDRFQTVVTAITSLVITSQQVTDAPSNSGFNYSYKYTVTTAATAYGSGGRTGILHRIEGYNSADLMFGTANAKSVTLSFWVKSSVTGTYSVGFLNNDSTRAFPATYTVNSANTWEYKTITLAGCPDGTWLTTNGRGIQVEFCLGADASRLGTANTWNNAFVTGATGTTLLSNTAGATFYITGVQLEKGSTATSFDYRPYGTELQLCQRYFETSYDYGTAVGTVTNAGCIAVICYNTSTNRPFLNCPFKVTKRTTPTVTPYNPYTGGSGTMNGPSNAAVTSNLYYTGFGSTNFYASGSGSATSNGDYYQHWTASAEL